MWGSAIRTTTLFSKYVQKFVFRTGFGNAVPKWIRICLSVLDYMCQHHVKPQWWTCLSSNIFQLHIIYTVCAGIRYGVSCLRYYSSSIHGDTCKWIVDEFFKSIACMTHLSHALNGASMSAGWYALFSCVIGHLKCTIYRLQMYVLI